MNVPRTLSSALFSVLSVSGLLFAQTSPTEWDRLMDAGEAATTQKQYAQAEDSYRQAWQYAESHWKNDARSSAALIKLAETCNAEGRKQDAENYANSAVAVLSQARKAHKPKDATEEYEQLGPSADLLTRAGDLFAANEKYSEAEGLYRRVIALRETYANEKPTSRSNNEDFFRFTYQTTGNAQARVADAQDKLGSLYMHEHKFDQAREQFELSRDIREKEFGPDKPPVTQSLSQIAMCDALQGKYDVAEPLYKRVVSILEQSKLADSAEMAIALENYYLVLKKMGREAEAKPFLERAHDIRTHLSNKPNTVN